MEDWRCDLPTDYTREWKYLDRIITAVKEVFIELKNTNRAVLELK